MPKPELVDSSAPKTYTLPIQKHLVVVTWAMRRQEPHLFFWRDHNSYDNDPYLIHPTEPGQGVSAAARAVQS